MHSSNHTPQSALLSKKIFFFNEEEKFSKFQSEPISSPSLSDDNLRSSKPSKDLKVEQRVQGGPHPLYVVKSKSYE